MNIKSSTRAVLSTLSTSRLRSLLLVLPLVMLLVGLSTEFLFDNIIGYFRLGTFSAIPLTVAVNFSPSHHFLGFLSQNFNAEGNIEYQAYNRFPPGGYVLIKLVTLPFGHNLSGGIYVARFLVLLFFVGAAILAYRSLCRLISNRWIALTATLMAFSSTLLLRFNTTLLPEIMIGLFGFALTFHGMVIFTQEGRFRQLVLKACIALLVDWHILALLVAFILLSVAKDITKAYKTEPIRKIIVSMINSRYTILGTIAFGFGILILAHNIGNEYYALNKDDHQQALLDLPTIRSALQRTSITGPQPEVTYPQLGDLHIHLKGVALATVPFVFAESLFSTLDPGWVINTLKTSTGWDEFRIVGVFVTVISLIGVFLVRHRLLAATAVFAGFCWTIPLRQNFEQHIFEGVYFIGISLFFYTLIFLIIRKYLPHRITPFCSVIALLIFIFSSYQMSIERSGEFSIDYEKEIVDDFNIIRQFIDEKTVFLPRYEDLGFFRLNYYNFGSRILFNSYGCDRRLDKVDFIVQTKRDKIPGLLTPNNQRVFLYDQPIYERRIDKIIEEERPLIQGDFDVYLTDDRKLIYVSDRCDGDDTKSTFLGVPISVLIYPVDIKNLPQLGQDHEFNQLNSIDHYIMDTKRNVLIFDLPDYDISSIRTGQYTDEGPIWSGRFFGPDYVVDADLRRQTDQALTSNEPVLRGHFDLYITDDNRLIYVRYPCFDDDISDDFFLHIIPVDLKELPEHRREYDFDGLDFVFFDRGFMDGQRCAAVIDLPDYDIASIRTGQFTNQGQIWRSEFNVSDER